jgi:hypothetical protein
MMNIKRRYYLIGSLSVCLVVLFFFCLAFLKSQTLAHLTNSPKATLTQKQIAQTQLATTPTSTTSISELQQGWVKKGPGYAESIAFAPSNPSIAYACGFRDDLGGTPSMQAGTTTLVVTISHDGGDTWSDPIVVQSGVYSSELYVPSIDPVNPNDVIIVGDEKNNDNLVSPLSMLAPSANGKRSFFHWLIIRR